MSSNTRLRSAVRVALGMSTGVFATMVLAPSTMAQAPQADQSAVVDEIVVTGSRIRRADLESASPISVVQREDIVLTGLTDVGSFIQRMPSMSGSPIGTTVNNGGNGSVQIDLRGLGVDRTLTLINGNRVVDGGDFQTIPSTMIERVEILKDGASAVYGADAVAGVVNIITRRDFEGLQFDAQTSDFFDMDSGRQTSFGMIAGTAFSTPSGRSGNFVFGAEYVKQDEAYQSDAPWAFFQDALYIYPQGCEKHPALPYDGTPEGGCYRGGSSRIPEGRLQFASHTPLTPAVYMNPDGSGLVPYDGRFYNFAPVNYIQTPYERINLFTEANFDISPSVRFRSELRANFRESAQELAPQPYNSPTDPGFSGIWNGTPYNGISEQNFYLVQAVTAAGLPQEPVFDARRRMVEIARRFTQEITQFQGVFGFEGDFRDMNWELTYNKGYRSRIDQDFGQFFGPALTKAMGPSADLNNDGVPECYEDVNDPNSLIVGCVPMNFFGGPGSVTQEMLDYVGVDLIDGFLTQHDLVSGSVSGSAFELPGGPLGWAVGAAYWAQRFEYSPDAAKQQGEATGNVGAGTRGWLYTNSLFAEALAPVFNNGSQAVDLRGGVRWDDYNIFGSETTWQFGVEFRVIESLKLRATAGTVYRAPTITDLFGGIIDSFPTYADPCIPPPGDPLPPGCAQVGVQTDSQLLARIGGNPNLKPETGDTFTAGLVWTPDFGQGDLSITVDYWNTEVEDGISSLGVQFILNDCYINQNPASCELVTRRPNYDIDNVRDTALNVAEQTAAGIDTEIRYTWDTAIGQFRASLLWAHMLERTKTAFPGAEKEKLEGRYTDVTAQDGGAYAEDKISYGLQWYRGDLSISYLGEYISALDADTFEFAGPYIQKIDSILYHDLVASYEFTQTNTRVTAGITNITDEPPPFIEIGFNAGTDPSTYRLFGRGYWVRLEQKF
jgi:iron complex outermembrane recepter protein